MLFKSVIPWFICICLTTFISESSFADEALNNSIHHQKLSLRSLGMGGGFIAIADDYNALYENPAGLARLQDWQVNVGFGFALSKDIFKFVDDIKKAGETSGSDSEKTEELLNVISDRYGERYYLRGELLSTTWVWPQWGVGFSPLDFTVDASIQKQAGPQVNYTLYADTTLAVGHGRDVNWIPQAHTSIGITTKIVNRLYADKAFQAVDLALNPDFLNNKDFFTEGQSIDLDFGTLITPNIPSSGLLSHLSWAKPTFGLVVRNLLGGEFSRNKIFLSKNDGSGSSDDPKKLHRVVDFGSRWEFLEWGMFQSRMVFDVRDMGHPNYTLLKGIHLGAELDWNYHKLLNGSWRLGFNQGYWSLGASAKLAWLNIDLATWGEEVGTKNSRKESRLYMLNFNMKI